MEWRDSILSFCGSVNYMNVLPNEIVCVIFKEVLLNSTLDEITNYRLISKQTGRIVEKILSALRNEWAYSVRGFSLVDTRCLKQTKKLLDYLPPNIIDCLQSNKEWIQEEGVSDVKHIYLRFKNYRVKIMDLNSNNSKKKRARMDFCFDGPDSGFRVLQTYKPFFEVTDTIWNYKKLVLNYPVYWDATFHSMFNRLYKTEKDYFTLGDIIDRINQFYQTGFTRWEYSLFLKQITAQSIQLFNRLPTSFDLLMDSIDWMEHIETFSLEDYKSLGKHRVSIMKNIILLNGSMEDQLIFFCCQENLWI